MRHADPSGSMSPRKKPPAMARVRLVLVDQGVYHNEDVELPVDRLELYEQLIDCIREDPKVLRGLYVDVKRLCAAYRV